MSRKFSALKLPPLELEFPSKLPPIKDREILKEENYLLSCIRKNLEGEYNREIEIVLASNKAGAKKETDVIHPYMSRLYSGKTIIEIAMSLSCQDETKFGIEYDNYELLEILLKNGANPNDISPDTLTALEAKKPESFQVINAYKLKNLIALNDLDPKDFLTAAELTKALSLQEEKAAVNTLKNLHSCLLKLRAIATVAYNKDDLDDFSKKVIEIIFCRERFSLIFSDEEIQAPQILLQNPSLLICWFNAVKIVKDESAYKYFINLIEDHLKNREIDLPKDFDGHDFIDLMIDNGLFDGDSDTETETETETEKSSLQNSSDEGESEDLQENFDDLISKLKESGDLNKDIGKLEEAQQYKIWFFAINSMQNIDINGEDALDYYEIIQSLATINPNAIFWQDKVNNQNALQIFFSNLNANYKYDINKYNVSIIKQLLLMGSETDSISQKDFEEKAANPENEDILNFFNIIKAKQAIEVNIRDQNLVGSDFF